MINDESLEFMTDDEIDEIFGINEIMDKLREIEKLKTDKLMMDVLVFKKIEKACHLLAKSIDGNSYEMGVDRLEEPTTAYIDIECEDLIIKKPKYFAEAIALCDNMEAYAKVNGKTRLSFTFFGLYRYL